MREYVTGISKEVNDREKRNQNDDVLHLMQCCDGPEPKQNYDGPEPKEMYDGREPKQNYYGPEPKDNYDGPEQKQNYDPTVDTLVERFNAYAEPNSETRLSGKECAIHGGPSINIDVDRAQDNLKIKASNTKMHEISDIIVADNLVDIENSQPAPNYLVSVKSTAPETHTSPGNNTGSTADLVIVIDKPEPRALYIDLITTNNPDKHSNDGLPATDNHDDEPVMDSVDDGLVANDNLHRDVTQDGLVCQMIIQIEMAPRMV